jgi:hypothetical protein
MATQDGDTLLLLHEGTPRTGVAAPPTPLWSNIQGASDPSDEIYILPLSDDRTTTTAPAVKYDFSTLDVTPLDIPVPDGTDSGIDLLVGTPLAVGVVNAPSGTDSGINSLSGIPYSLLDAPTGIDSGIGSLSGDVPISNDYIYDFAQIVSNVSDAPDMLDSGNNTFYGSPMAIEVVNYDLAAVVESPLSFDSIFFGAGF